MSSIKKWKLLSAKDVSPSKWFPIEMRTYELPNGRIIDDFSVTTLPDVAMIIPMTTQGKVVMVRQYKPGVDEVMIQFPAGRIERDHADVQETAMHELEEETGIHADKENFEYFGKLSGFSTKASEVVYLYFVGNCTFNSAQNLDPTEEIEVLEVAPPELEAMITSGEIWCAQTIAAWQLAKQKFLTLGVSA